MMTMTPQTLADAILTTDYFDDETIAELRNADDLLDDLDLDLRDLMHNANLDMIIPDADSLTDDEYELLSDFIADHSHEIAALLALALAPRL